MEYDSKHSKQQAIVERVDKITSSPSIRASRIYEILKPHFSSISIWDLICFCVETLAWISVSHEWLQQPIKYLSLLVYNYHYQNPSEIIEFDKTYLNIDNVEKKEGG